YTEPICAQPAGRLNRQPLGGFRASNSYSVSSIAGGAMNRVMSIVEKTVLYALMILMAIVLLLATLDLIWTIILAIKTPPFFLITLDTLLEVFGLFLLVLVGLELLDTITSYIREHVVHAEIVMLAAMIAVARKAIAFDLTKSEPIVAFGLAALVLALSAAYFLLRRAGFTENMSKQAGSTKGRRTIR
ncbi:MAG: phosphate-starvation-inducible PsiE family protein, partial [Anaerolineales bacterium]